MTIQHRFRLAMILATVGASVLVAACTRPTPIAGVLPSPGPPTLTAEFTLAAAPTPTPQPTSAPSATASIWPTVETATPIVLSDSPPTETPTPTFSAASPTPTRTAMETSTATPFTPGSSATPATPATATVTPTERPVATSTSTPTFTAPPMPAYLSGVTARAREIFVAGQQRGQNAHAFALVGDSNTDNPAFFAPFDAGHYTLGDYAALQDSITYFSGSFGRDSVAAVGGFNTSKELDPAYNDPARCAANESPLVCEYRWQRPSVALILLGTGDQHSWTGFEGRYRQIIEYTIAQGIVPVLITKADDLEATDNTAPSGYINGVIARLSGEYSVPLLDLWQAIAPLPNRGLLPDGFHYNAPVDGQSANFTDGYLDYGFNMRNLTGLQALDAVRRAVMFDVP